VKSMAVSVNSASIESTDSVSVWAIVPVDGLDDLLAGGEDGLYIFVQNELQLLHGCRSRSDSLMMIFERTVLLRTWEGTMFFAGVPDSGHGVR